LAQAEEAVVLVAEIEAVDDLAVGDDLDGGMEEDVETEEVEVVNLTTIIIVIKEPDLTAFSSHCTMAV